MIVKVSDLLKEIIEKEKEVIKKYEVIDHGPTIGDMYEGLTEDILNKSLFKELNIKVVSGKIRNQLGDFSNEVDCMIVVGEGEKIPYTEKYIYDFTQVIAILEVKKTLYKSELIDSYEKMKKIYLIGDNTEINMRSFKDSFVSIVKKELPNYEDVEKLPFHEQMIYHSLLTEETLPVRIVFGYYGYKDEYGLRKGLIDLLEEGSNEDEDFVFSPVILPDLIICGNSSLIKLDGMPYIGGIDNNDNYWNLCASSNHNPLLHLLEFIWTKLSYKYRIDSTIFGEDLKVESLSPLLKAKGVLHGEKKGWKYIYTHLSRKELSNSPTFIDWEPAELDDHQAIIISMLCKKGEIDVSESSFKEWVTANSIDFEKMFEDLNNKGLTYFDGKKLTLITEKCQLVTLKGKWYAADNISGRLTRWIENERKK